MARAADAFGDNNNLISAVMATEHTRHNLVGVAGYGPAGVSIAVHNLNNARMQFHQHDLEHDELDPD